MPSGYYDIIVRDEKVEFSQISKLNKYFELFRATNIIKQRLLFEIKTLFFYD